MPSGRDAPTQIAPRTERWLLHALVATVFVVVLPALVIWRIVPRGEPALLALSVPLGMLLSVLAASVGSALWKRVPGSRDLVFADLVLWGWLRRLRAEHRLAHAETLLGDGAEALGAEALSNLSALLEARDSFTTGHSQRVTRHAERIATEMGLSAAAVAQVRTAAALHDVGKLHTPRDILNKPGRLTDEEFEVIRRHPGAGADMSTSVGDPVITAMVRHHHERLDGAGYPAGLAGTAIPLGARIIAVADTFDAMTSNRAYRRASSHKVALDVLRHEAGAQLDAGAVAAFVGYYGGRRTVAWSAFATSAPQRLFAWLGGVSPGVSAGVAGAAALAIGVAGPQPPAVSSAAAAPRHASKRAGAAAPGAGRVRPAQTRSLGSAPDASGQPSTRRSRGNSSRPRRAKRRSGARTHSPAALSTNQTAKPPTVKVERVKAVRPQTVKPQTGKSHTKRQTAKPEKVKPQTGKSHAKRQTAKPEKVKPQTGKSHAMRQAAKPEKVKPPNVTPPAVKPPKVTPPAVKPPKLTPPEVVAEPAAPPQAKPPKQ